MAVLRIHTVPDDEAFLRRIAEPVREFGPALKRIAADMLETLPVAHGIGLAAPQVGHSVRVVLIDVSGTGQEDDPVKPPPAFFLVNPVITAGEGEASLAEGCLSVPGVRVEIPRRAKVSVDAVDLEGRAIHLDAEGLLAIVIQHELDHLDGKLIPDYIARGCRWWKEGEQPAETETLD